MAPFELDVLVDSISDQALLAPLPPLHRTNRMPDFWPDLEVRRLVLATHRQMTIADALRLIRTRVGDRCPTKSALARTWLRLDRRTSHARKGR